MWLAVSTLRCVCAVLLAGPLLASLYVALLRWRRQREVTPSPHTPLNSDPSHYGSVLSNGSPASQADMDTPENITADIDDRTSEDSSPKSKSTHPNTHTGKNTGLRSDYSVIIRLAVNHLANNTQYSAGALNVILNNYWAF